MSMASHPHDFGRASALPLSAALAIIPSLPRPILCRLVARAIERLDEIDGDPDAEVTGDEGEPDFRRFRQQSGMGAGCPISDPDLCLAHEDRGVPLGMTAKDRGTVH